jgi:hypothetical protein
MPFVFGHLKFYLPADYADYGYDLSSPVRTLQPCSLSPTGRCSGSRPRARRSHARGRSRRSRVVRGPSTDPGDHSSSDIASLMGSSPCR